LNITNLFHLFAATSQQHHHDSEIRITYLPFLSNTLSLVEVASTYGIEIAL